MILIAGGTGRLGRELVPLLQSKGHRVRVLTRDVEHARRILGTEPEMFAGDVRHPASLAEAAKNVDAVVSAVTGFGPGGAGPASVDYQGNLNLIQAAQAAGVNHFVLLSMHRSVGDHPMELLRMKFRAEQALRASRMQWTIVRPTVFMELWTGIVCEPIRVSGRATLFGRGENPVNFVSVKDLARFVEVALSDPRLRGRVLDVGGPEDISLIQMVRSFEGMYGKKVRIRHIPRTFMRFASVALRPFRNDLAGMIGAGIVMDTTDMRFDARDLQRAYPEIELTNLAVVARNLLATT